MPERLHSVCGCGLTLSAIETLWTGEKPNQRSSILDGLAGYLHAGARCKWCKNRHHAGWICAVGHEHDSTVLLEWLSANAGAKADILQTNPKLKHILRAHLTAKVSALNRYPRPACGMERDLFDLYNTAAEPEHSAVDSEWQEVMVALVDRTVPRGPGGAPVVAGVLEFESVAHSAGLYPVCCQTFLLGDDTFSGSFEAARAAIDNGFHWQGPHAPKHSVGLRWRLRTRDGRPITEIEGGSLDLACQLGARNTLLRLSAGNCDRSVNRADSYELTLRNIGVSARVIAGAALEAVSADTIKDKIEKLLEEGAEYVLISVQQKGLEDASPAIKRAVVRRGTVQCVWRSILVRQSETVLEVISARGFAPFCIAGYPLLIWTATLFTAVLWAAFERPWYVLPSALLAVAASVAPGVCRRQRSPKRSLLHDSERRTPYVWGTMASVLARRLRIARQRRWFERLGHSLASDMAFWLAGLLKTSQVKRCHVPRSDLLRISLREAWLRGGFIPVMSMILVLMLLSGPLQSQMAELLPPWHAAEILGGTASRDFSALPTDWRPRPGRSGRCRVFVAQIGLEGEMAITAEEKMRAERFLRVKCNNCVARVPIGVPPHLSPVTEPLRVIHGQTSFSYFAVATANASVSLTLLDSLGHDLACADVELRRE